MKQKNILFVCKYNRFRSRIAEAYFNKINKNKKWKAQSAGVIKGNFPLEKKQVIEAGKFGININGIPKPLSSKMLSKIDLVIIVANDVPKEIFKYKGKYLQKIIVWKIKDWKGKSPKEIGIIVEGIINKVKIFAKELK